jgi:hypothetical protein
MKLAFFFAATASCAQSIEAPGPDAFPPPSPGSERGWVVVSIDLTGTTVEEIFHPVFVADVAGHDVVGPALAGRCHGREPWDVEASIAALGGEPLDPNFDRALRSAGLRLLGPSALPIGPLVIRADVRFDSARAGPRRGVESMVPDHCGTVLRLDGCVEVAGPPCMWETTEIGETRSHEISRSIAIVRGIPASELVVDASTADEATTFHAELALLRGTSEGFATVWEGDAIESLDLTTTGPDRDELRFGERGRAWMRLDASAILLMHSFWIDAKTGPEPNARRLRWWGNAAVIREP